jgi:cytochrome c oxidase assembly protein subunit 11
MTERKLSQKKLIAMLAGLGVAFFGIGFAMVPLYNLICDVTGVNTISGSGGRVTLEEALAAKVDYDRQVIVEFDATLNEKLPWEIQPLTRRMTVHPGKVYEVKYFARNTADKAIVGQAIPSITPWQATEHFNKTECFCFQQQKLEAGEGREMVLQFVLDNKLPDKYSTVTLSYTFMDTADGIIQPTDRPHEKLSLKSEQLN